MLKFTIEYTDGDWHYAHQPEEIVYFETVEEAQKHCDDNSIRRDYRKIIAVNDVPYQKWRKENDAV